LNIFAAIMTKKEDLSLERGFTGVTKMFPQRLYGMVYPKIKKEFEASNHKKYFSQILLLLCA
jgi:hypothetical protein